MMYIKRKTKILSCLLAVLLIIVLSACGNIENQKNNSVTDSNQNNNSSESYTNDTKNANNKILIAYFTAAENSGVDAVASASYTMINGEAVGRVRALADMIKNETGGDTFSIRTSVVYPADGGALIDYAAKEQDENARPELTSKIENFDEYDTVFVGYPNWWYDMPMIMYSFLMSMIFRTKQSFRLTHITAADFQVQFRLFRSLNRTQQ